MAPKSRTIEEWKKQFKWLKVVDGKLICTICISQKSKLELERDFKPAFVNGSTNFKHSALAEHDGNECHKKAKRWQEYGQAVSAGEALPKKMGGGCIFFIFRGRGLQFRGGGRL